MHAEMFQRLKHSPYPERGLAPAQTSHAKKRRAGEFVAAYEIAVLPCALSSMSSMPAAF
jgi:hypothetical protein